MTRAGFSSTITRIEDIVEKCLLLVFSKLATMIKSGPTFNEDLMKIMKVSVVYLLSVPAVRRTLRAFKLALCLHYYNRRNRPTI